ncbi:ANTAR domain-containing response regulator [Anaeromicropila populeti]|uniref:Response regulator NasT n=1 Tax=Anaeromicropila populeti TaxID=37658 RepID=A0A1I6JMD7_9FIRM|nr:ANTAR domain-containing protein [Anaeromicropila populeti]SFR80097.1 response regulator NasT [Anaeromicropila populeti]
MLSIIVVFPKIEDAKNIRNVLIRSGYEVQAVCTTGAQAITLVNELDEGIVLCGYRFSDMHYSELHNILPKSFEMLLVASPTKLEECVNSDIVCLGMPIKTRDLINTIEMMTLNYNRRKRKKKDTGRQRSSEDRATIDKAKAILMDRNNMSEEDAHRYIQKTSMDSGTNMVETAEMIISMMREY